MYVRQRGDPLDPILSDMPAMHCNHFIIDTCFCKKNSPEHFMFFMVFIQVSIYKCFGYKRKLMQIPNTFHNNLSLISRVSCPVPILYLTEE